MLMRSVRSATWTSGEPVSPCLRWYSVTMRALSAVVTDISLLSNSLDRFRLGELVILAWNGPQTQGKSGHSRFARGHEAHRREASGRLCPADAEERPIRRMHRP